MIVIEFLENHWILSLLGSIFVIVLASIMNAPTIDEEAILSRTRRANRYVLVTDAGDASVGIFPQSWMVEVPFSIDINDKEMLEDFRAGIARLYNDYCDGRCRVEYDFELQFKEEFDGL